MGSGRHQTKQAGQQAHLFFHGSRRPLENQQSDIFGRVYGISRQAPDAGQPVIVSLDEQKTLLLSAGIKIRWQCLACCLRMRIIRRCCNHPKMRERGEEVELIFGSPPGDVESA